jgi:hypothetical protein
VESEIKPIKPLKLNKLREDLQLIIDEIDRIQVVLPDYYSPVLRTRVQETAEKVSRAIQVVRMKFSGKTLKEISDTLGLGVWSVNGYLASNTMFDPAWIKPGVARNRIACPLCHAPMGSECSGPRIHKSRIEAFRNSTEGQAYLQTKAENMKERYGVKTVAAE